MGDPFHQSVDRAWLDEMFAVMAIRDDYDFLMLTKRAHIAKAYYRRIADRRDVIAAALARLGPQWLKYVEIARDRLAFGAPRNVWAGVSVGTNDATVRLDDLVATPAHIRFVSMEPLLEDVPIDKWASMVDRSLVTDDADTIDKDVVKQMADVMAFKDPSAWALHWVIFGGESGNGKTVRTCDVRWIRKGVETCKKYNVAAYVKQLGAHATGWCVSRLDAGASCADDHCRLRDEGEVQTCARGCQLMTRGKGNDMAEWPIDLRVREFPSAVIPR
jgi:protein gp37